MVVNMVVNISDLDRLKESAMQSFEQRLAKADLRNRVEVEREVARLESQLEQLYSFTALIARHETDVTQTADLWLTLVQICDVFAARVYQLSQDHPVAASGYDRMLDIRSAAEELRALHSP